MNRNICVYLDFLSPAHQEQIRQTAAALGFTAYFFQDPEQFEEARDCLQRCEVLYGHSSELLRTAPASLRWYCCSYAGVDEYCSDPAIFPNPECMLTNSNSYGVAIAEHVVMVSLMLLRRMPEYQLKLQARQWSRSLPIRSIRDGAFTVLGTGNIGSNVARCLRGMNAGKITGLSRSGRPHPDFDEVLPISRLDEILPKTEFLIMALPSTPDTFRILNRARIALLPPTAYVVNVGRGTAIEQESLAEALHTGRLAGAALDVFDQEPLPPDHPLWETPNLIITPHTSGNTTLGYTCNINVDMFCQDLQNYAAGRPLKNLVDRARGY